MRLHNAAAYFDKTICTEAYAASSSFLGQLDLFDDSRRDGATVKRRIFSVAPSVAMPARGAFTAAGKTWIVGAYAPDDFKGTEIRRKYVVQQSDGLATVKTMAQALSAAAGTSAHASMIWIKEGKELDTSALMFDAVNIIFAQGEPAVEKALVNLGGRWYLVRAAYTSAAGFLTAVADELPEPVLETITLGVRTYVPATDTYTTANSSVSLIRIRWQSHFDYLTQGSTDYERGDLQGMMLKTAATPKAGDTLTLSDGKWNVLAVTDEAPVWGLHLRRA